MRASRSSGHPGEPQRALRRPHRTFDRPLTGRGFTCRPARPQANPGAKEDYKSDKAARPTLRELERWIGHEVAGRYHNSVHSSLKRPPIAVGEIMRRSSRFACRSIAWRSGVAFLPEQERTLRRDGIHLFGLTYWSSVLTADVGRLKKEMLVKYDPRDLSRIFVLRPSGHFIEARYGDITLPAISLQEAQSASRALAAKGRREKWIAGPSSRWRSPNASSFKAPIAARSNSKAKSPALPARKLGTAISARFVDRSRTRITSVEGYV